MGVTKKKGVRSMKKYLAILGLLALISQPVFAQCCNQCNTCLPRAQVIQVPVVQSCAPACPAPVITGAACPCNTCDPCMTGLAYPINPCNQCNTCNPCDQHKGFWSRFFGY